MNLKKEHENAATTEQSLEAETSLSSIVIGKAFVIDTSIIEPEDTTLTDPEDIEFEQMRFEEAYEEMIQIFNDRMNHAEHMPIEVRDEIINMITTDIGMCNTERRHIKAEINKGKTADRVFYDHFSKYINTLEQMDLPEFKSKAEDCKHILRTFLQKYHPEHYAHVATVEDIPDGSIPVMRSMPVRDVGILRNESGRARVNAMINWTGTAGDHTHIICNGANINIGMIPTDSKDKIQEGDTIILDGQNNEIIVNPSKETLETYQKVAKAQKSTRDELLKQSQSLTEAPATHDGQTIRVSGNIGFSDEAREINRVNAKGIGLYRTEMAYLVRGPHSQSQMSDKHWFRIFADIAETSPDDILDIRTLDLAGDKTAGTSLERIEQIIHDQMVAFTKVRQEYPEQSIDLMIPNAHGADDFLKYQRIMDEIINEINKTNKTQNKKKIAPIKIGAMAETTSFINQLDQIEPKFISIGTNDLIARVIGYDRYDPNEAHLYDPTNPSVLESIEKVVEYQTNEKETKDRDVAISVCGEMASDPRYLALLIGAGVRSLSTGPYQVPMIKKLVSRINTKDAERLFQEIKSIEKGTDVQTAREKREKMLDEFNKKHMGYDPEDPVLINLKWTPPEKSSESENNFTITT